jgi:hypothetical protein
MANTIKIKQSSEANKVPAAGDLLQGELAINTVDEKLYSSNGTSVFELSGGSDALATSSTVGTASFSSANFDVSATGQVAIKTKGINSTDLDVISNGNQYQSLCSDGGDGFTWEVAPRTITKWRNNIGSTTWVDFFKVYSVDDFVSVVVTTDVGLTITINAGNKDNIFIKSEGKQTVVAGSSTQGLKVRVTRKSYLDPTFTIAFQTLLGNGYEIRAKVVASAGNTIYNGGTLTLTGTSLIHECTAGTAVSSTETGAANYHGTSFNGTAFNATNTIQTDGQVHGKSGLLVGESMADPSIGFLTEAGTGFAIRSLTYADATDDWQVEDNAGTMQTLYHSGNLTPFSKATIEADTTGLNLTGSLNLGNDAGITSTTTDGSLRVLFPGGGSRKNVSSSETGAIKITLPVGMTNGMLSIKATIYEYSTNESFEVTFGGYTYPGGNTWQHNPFGYIIGSPKATQDYALRFGFDSNSKACLYIGELTTVWSYPQISVTEIEVGFSQYDADTWDNGWDVTIASSFENVTATIAKEDTRVGAASGSVDVDELIITSSAPQVKLVDSDAHADDFWLHANSDSFYVLTDRNNDGDFADANVAVWNSANSTCTIDGTIDTTVTAEVDCVTAPEWAPPLILTNANRNALLYGQKLPKMFVQTSQPAQAESLPGDLWWDSDGYTMYVAGYITSTFVAWYTT